MALLGLAGLQTPPGRDAAALLASRFYSAVTGMTVRIEAVSGTVPVDVTVGRLAVADAKGVWLAVKDLHFAWSPLALLRGRVLVRNLSADIVRVRRLAETPSPAAEPLRVEWPPRFPSLPPILVDSLGIDRLILDAALVGQDATFHVSGRLAESGQGAVAASLAANRLDGSPLTLTVAGALNYAAWRLAAKANLTEAPGGLLATALAGRQTGPLELALTGDGPLTAWKAQLIGSLSGRPLVSAVLGLAIPLDDTATASWSLDGETRPPVGELPGWAARLARLIGERCSLQASGRVGLVSGAFFLDRAAIQAAAGTLQATAALDPNAATVAAKLTLAVPDAGRLDPALAGDVEAAVTVSGRLDRPEIGLTATARDVHAGPASLEAAQLTVGCVLAGDLNDKFPGATVTATGSLTGLSGPDGTSLLGRDLRLALDAAVSATGAVTARDLALTGPGGAVRAQGSLSPDGVLAATLSATLEDVAGAAGLAGLRLSGQATATAAIAREPAGTGRISLDLRLARLAANASSAASAALAGLLGTEPSLTAQIDLDAGGAKLSQGSLTGSTLRLTGSGTYAADSGRLTGKTTVEVKSLTPLGAALGTRLAGEGSLDLALSGTLAAPDITLTAQAKNLTMATTTLDGIDIAATVTDPFQRPAGRVRLTARARPGIGRTGDRFRPGRGQPQPIGPAPDRAGYRF